MADSDIGSIDSTGPASRLRAVTPSDSTIVNCRGFYVGVAGNVAVIGMDDSAAVTLVAVPAGALMPIQCSKIMSTNTTATSIVALY